MTNKWRRGRIQRRNEARRLRCMSDIRTRAGSGPRTIWRMTEAEEKAWDEWNDRHWSAVHRRKLEQRRAA